MGKRKEGRHEDALTINGGMERERNREERRRKERGREGERSKSRERVDMERKVAGTSTGRKKGRRWKNGRRQNKMEKRESGREKWREGEKNHWEGVTWRET